MMNGIHMQAIGRVVSTRREPTDDYWDGEDSHIELSDAFGADALAGLETFSHVEIVFYMDQVRPEKIETGARHPRNDTTLPKTGIFSQRGKNRPNQIGLVICRILKVAGTRLYLQGLDAVDGTPVLDIKPWVREFGPRGDVVQPQWISDLMEHYWE